MAEALHDVLKGRCVLVVEDDYLIATELRYSLEEAGAVVIGPAGTVLAALAEIEREGARLDSAVLDINLRDERVYPVADVLMARGVPFLFTTGYDALAIPPAYALVPRCEKPVDRGRLKRLLLQEGRG